MLWIEVASLTAIFIVVILVLFRHGAHLDLEQLRLRGMTGSGLRLGLVLALFSYVGFESATRLGAEARDPLRTIPRAVIQSAVFSGVIFVVCAYAEVLGFRSAGQDLGTSPAPMHVLANVGGVPVLGLLIDNRRAGQSVCRYARWHHRRRARAAPDGPPHGSLRSTHIRNATPSRGILVTGISALLPVVILAMRGASGLDVYGWLGSLATYGFIVTYALVSISLPHYLRELDVFHTGSQVIPVLAFVAMFLAVAGNLYPIPAGPYGKLPLIYLACLALGMIWFFAGTWREREAAAEG
jgi:amino acid transporter